MKPTTTYFINKINSIHPISLVIAENPNLSISNPSMPISKRLAERLSNRDWQGIINSLKSRFLFSLISLRKILKGNLLEKKYRKIFDADWKNVDPNIKLLWVKNVNSDDVYELLKTEKPDVILDHGTSIVKDRIISTAPIALNVHWGLSPYYRGTHCTNWALFNRDPYNIGVTVHTLSKEVDGGGIVAQTRVIPETDDGVRSINAKLTKAGTAIMVKALSLMANGLALKTHPQDLSTGLLTRARDYTKDIASEVGKIEKAGLASLLNNPTARKRQPIVENVEFLPSLR